MLGIAPQMLSAQIVEGLRPKFFTLRNARLSLGGYLNGNLTNAQGKNYLNAFTGNLPNDVSIQFMPEDFPYLSGGLQFDLFAPNSLLSLSLGAEYNLFNFQIENEASQITTVEAQSFRIPAYLKFNIGKIHSQMKGLLMTGGIYSIPTSYAGLGPNGASRETSTLANTFSLSLLGGVQYRFIGDEKEKFDIGDSGNLQGEYTRVWLFVRGDLLMESLFNPTFPADNQLGAGFDYRDLNITVGLAFFFGLQKR